MDFQKEYLDLLLVPTGMMIMFAYHIFLLYKLFNYPETTIIGLENQDKKDWVESVVKGGDSVFSRAIDVISSNITASIYLATISLTLSSLIGTYLASSSSTYNSVLQSSRVYGDTRPFTIFIKNVCLLTCLLVGFSGFVHSAKHLIHANYLMSSPNNKHLEKKVQFAITKGNDCWVFGLRALYFALNMLLWFFGPIPMFVSSFITVIVLYYHDFHVVTLHNIYCGEDTQKGRKSTGRSGFSY